MTQFRQHRVGATVWQRSRNVQADVSKGTKGFSLGHKWHSVEPK